MVEVSYTRFHETTGDYFSQSVNAAAGQEIAHLLTHSVSAGIISTLCH